MEQFFANNISILFIVALFYAAVSGIKLTTSLRVGLVYSFSILVVLFGSLDWLAITFGSLLVLFLVIEIFDADPQLARLFSSRRRLVDFLFRLLFVYYGWLFAACMTTLWILDCTNVAKAFLVFVGLMSMLILLLWLSRCRFSIKTVSEMIKMLENNCNPKDYGKQDKLRIKFKILSAMEDREFFARRENQHTITLHQVARAARKRISLRRMLHPITSAKSIISRGYGTIEMQLIRTVGIEMGSYSLVFRRKVFELLYANMVINGYLEQFEKGKPTREHIRNWICESYINNVSVKFGELEYYPTIKSNTITAVYKRDLPDISNEEFFVWCLGLPYYKTGVGPRSVKIHQDIVEEFNLDEQAIADAIDRVNQPEPALA